MPSINQGFNKLKSNLEVTQLQKTTAASRQKAVRKVIEKKFNVKESFLTGSYSRSCMISPLKQADIDIFFVLGADHHSYFHNDEPQKLLDDVRSALLETYPKTPKINRNGQAVTITFTDFKVDVVPCFKRSGGGYLIPNTGAGKSWIGTDPKAHDKIYTEVNTDKGGNFKALVKMLKAWNRANGSFFQSFHLEELARKVFLYNGIQDFPTALHYFWKWGEEKVDKKIQDPAGAVYNKDIAAYLDKADKWEEGKRRFRTARSRTEKAIAFAEKGNTEAAYSEWKKIFGDYFPSFNSQF